MSGLQRMCRTNQLDDLKPNKAYCTDGERTRLVASFCGFYYSTARGVEVWSLVSLRGLVASRFLNTARPSICPLFLSPFTHTPACNARSPAHANRSIGERNPTESTALLAPLWHSEHVIAIVHAHPATSPALNPALTLNSVWVGH